MAFPRLLFSFLFFFCAVASLFFVRVLVAYLRFLCQQKPLNALLHFVPPGSPPPLLIHYVRSLSCSAPKLICKRMKKVKEQPSANRQHMCLAHGTWRLGGLSGRFFGGNGKGMWMWMHSVAPFDSWIYVNRIYRGIG